MSKNLGIKKAPRARHGMVDTPEYRAWAAMIERCENPRCRYYKNYGARGITVHHDFRVSFMTFFEHVGPRPSPKHSLDRRNNSKGYEPGNLRWATRAEQNTNRRGNHILKFRGIKKCVIEWSRELGLSAQCIRGRLLRGWSVRRTLSTPLTRRAV